MTVEEQGQVYPPKPLVTERNDNAIVRSIISLLAYALLFYFIFDSSVAYIAAILLVLVVHEMGHFIAMRIFDYTNVKIFIVPLLGAFTTGKKQRVSQWQLSAIILAGPVPGIIAGTIMFLLNREAQNETVKMLSSTFLLINMLNLLPFFPLDGGRLVETLFFRENYVIRLVFGIISVIGLTVIFIFGNSFFLLFIPVLMIMDMRNEARHEKIREYLRQEKINYYSEYEQLPDKDYWLIRDCLIFSFPRKYGMLTPGRYEYSMFEPSLIRQVSSVLKTNLVSDLNVFTRLLFILLYIAMLFGPVIIYLLSKNHSI